MGGGNPVACIYSCRTQVMCSVATLSSSPEEVKYMSSK